MNREIAVTMTAAVLALLACGCARMQTEDPIPHVEMSFAPSSEGITTRGYSETDLFRETKLSDLHSPMKPEPAPRTMQISSYLHPQNDVEDVYFYDRTFSFSNDAEGRIWWNTNTVGGAHDPVYWPVGGTLDFLAYSVSGADSKGVVAEWDAADPASRLTLIIPGENSQNDILFASAYNISASSAATAVDLSFHHAQAWLEFEITGTPGVTLNKIEIEDAYNAGTLTVRNGNGKPTASWSFTGEVREDITVDNSYGVRGLGATVQYMDMLIPQQAKTSFALYYTVGTDPEVRKASVSTDKKTWLMGERYVYRLNVSPAEVTAEPEGE